LQVSIFLKNFKEKVLKKAFEDDTYIGRDAVYYHYYEYPLWHKVQPHYGIRTSRYKLMHFYYSMDEWELYDLKNDPQEMNNIYNQSSNDSLINLLKGKLLALQVEYGDNQTIEEMKLMTDTVIARSYKEPLFKKLKKQ
jgi:arylsulfatase A-like enzyme